VTLQQEPYQPSMGTPSQLEHYIETNPLALTPHGLAEGENIPARVAWLLAFGFHLTDPFEGY
jgi:hypothetical protein